MSAPSPKGNAHNGSVLRYARAAVTIRGQCIEYQRVGSGEAVVLVHGLAGSMRWWRRNVAALAREHTVYLLNLPGFGAFRWRGLRFSLEEAADWLAEWLDATGIGPCHIVAHSMGGHIAIRLAARRPALVRRLILVAPALVARGRPLRAYPFALLAACRAASPSFLPILALDTLRAGPLTILSATRGLIRHDIQHELREVRSPTLLVWGDRDALVPPTLAPLIQAEIPDARLVMLPGAGHVPQFDRAPLCNDAMLAFLAGRQVGDGPPPDLEAHDW
jgi:pimeloyl-ACP methyl ester carboxylesterase